MSEDVDSSQPVQNLGERIRSAREAKKLSQEDLATLLHLQINIIQALEDNRFEQLAAPTYVKGYIRNVARTIDLDGDELVTLYETGTPVSKGPEILPRVSKPAQFSSTDKPVKIMTYLISLGLVLLLLIWWQSEFIVNGSGSGSGPDASSADGPYPGGFDYSYDIVIHPQGPFYRAPDSNVSDEELVTELPDYSGNPPLLTIDSSVDSVSSMMEDPVSVPAAGGMLTIEVNADSWIEVRDASQEKLYLDIAKQGEVISLDGQTPLSVVLGNVEGVSIRWKGQTFDVSPYARAGVARFTLED